jgi:hypothetical protein
MSETPRAESHIVLTEDEVPPKRVGSDPLREQIRIISDGLTPELRQRLEAESHEQSIAQARLLGDISFVQKDLVQQGVVSAEEAKALTLRIIEQRLGSGR